MDPDPDPRKEIEVDPDLDPEWGLNWIPIRPNAVDLGGSGSGSETLMKNLEKLQFLFYSSSFIMEPKPKLRNFFGSGFSQKGRLRLRNSGGKFMLCLFAFQCIS